MRLAPALLLVALLAGCVVPTESTPGDAPIRYAPGEDAAPFGLRVADDGTGFTATLSGVPGARLAVDDLVRLANVDARERNVTLAATPQANPLVSEFLVEWMDGDAVVGALDLTSAEPTVAMRVPPGGSLSARVTLSLLDGAEAGTVVITTLVEP